MFVHIRNWLVRIKLMSLFKAPWSWESPFIRGFYRRDSYHRQEDIFALVELGNRLFLVKVRRKTSPDERIIVSKDTAWFELGRNCMSNDYERIFWRWATRKDPTFQDALLYISFLRKQADSLKRDIHEERERNNWLKAGIQKVWFGLDGLRGSSQNYTLIQGFLINLWAAAERGSDELQQAAAAAPLELGGRKRPVQPA